MLGTACVTIPAAEGAACKDYIFGTVAVGGTLVSCCLMASLPWLVDHIRGDCVINSAAVEVSRIKQTKKQLNDHDIITKLYSLSSCMFFDWVFQGPKLILEMFQTFIFPNAVSTI